VNQCPSGCSTPVVVIRDGMPFTEDDRGTHRSTVAELVAEIQRLRAELEVAQKQVQISTDRSSGNQ